MTRGGQAFDEIQELKAQLTTDPKWDIIGKFIKVGVRPCEAAPNARVWIQGLERRDPRAAAL